jgi:hypothetical protein
MSELQPDGSFHVKAEYLKKGQWVPGHQATYRVDPAAEAVFRKARSVSRQVPATWSNSEPYR